MFKTTPENLMRFREIFDKNYSPKMGSISLSSSLVFALLSVEDRFMSADEIREGLIVYCESLQNLGIDFPPRLPS